MIRLIASDLDGTILKDDYTIPEDNLKAIDSLKRNNIPFVVCTGKTYSVSKDICKNLHANFGIFGNGNQIINLSTGEEIERRTLSIDEIKTCISIVKKYNLHIHAYTEDIIITEKLMYMDLRSSILFSDTIKFKIVDLPLPDFPTNATVVLGFITNDKFLKIGSFLILSIGFLFLKDTSSSLSFSFISV